MALAGAVGGPGISLPHATANTHKPSTTYRIVATLSRNGEYGGGPGMFVPTLRQISFLNTGPHSMPATQLSDVRKCTAVGIPARRHRRQLPLGVCSFVQSASCRSDTLCVGDWGVPVTTDEHAACRIRELEETVRVLEDQNVQLKIAAREFGALAERLNARLMVESRRSWRVSVREAVAGIAGQFGVSRLRT